jgi:hypothetical protein
MDLRCAAPDARSYGKYLSMNIDALWPALTVLVFSAAQAADPHAALSPSTASGSVRPTADSEVVKVFTERPGEVATGPLHIIYSDGVDVVETVPPTAEPKTEDSQAGFTDLEISSDKVTVGWGETYWECCQSYPIPLVLTLYRSGKIIQRIRQGQMLWAWSFVDGTTQAATVWGTTHGPEVGDYRLYDVKTGRMLAEVYGDDDLQQLKSDAPDWTQKLQAKLDGVSSAASLP